MAHFDLLWRIEIFIWRTTTKRQFLAHFEHFEEYKYLKKHEFDHFVNFSLINTSSFYLGLIDIRLVDM